MAPPSSTQFQPECLRDAVMNCYNKSMNLLRASTYFKVPTPSIRNALSAISDVNELRVKKKIAPMLEDGDHQQVYQWVSRYTKAHMPRAHTCTKREVHAALFDDLSGRLRQNFIVEEYGIQRMTLRRLEKNIT